MPTIKYSNNPNEETAFVTQDGGQRNRAVLTAAVDGTIEYPNNPNSTKVMVTVDGVKRRAVAVADIAGGGGGGSGLPDQTGQGGKFLTTDGTDASWSDKPLVNTATGVQDSLTILGTPNNINNSANIGYGTSVTKRYSLAVGRVLSVTGEAACAFGTGAVSAKNGVLIGHGTVSAIGAIQISGKGGYTNSDADTFKVGNNNGNFEMMSADGTIPTARLTKVNTTVTLAAAGWSSNTQTVSITGITADGIVLVSPDPTDQSAYTSAGIICSAQAVGTLTFTCSTTPTADLSVNVVML